MRASPVPEQDGVPDPAPKRPKLTHRRPTGDEVIVLFVFDGVGAAPWLIWDLVGRPAAILTWETDRTASAVAKEQVPITDDDPSKVAAVVEKVDPWGRCVVIFTAAPPCQDFSRVTVTDGPGRDGARGGLFLRTVEFMHEVRRLGVAM